ncbi:amidohydrolase family protein [Apiosordaria backusii]|uniref:6-methylsalicylate decarboxylase n=1 Tax=Apiosordaria backusii TaxID=314023 RepID=A0AA40DXE6_9PEZI|nr:amidohydrolase family protein [Apiosordaria backusii]
MTQLIDVHHHFLPEEYVKAWKASGTIPPGLTPPKWTPEEDLAFMNRNSITTSILSLSAPGLTPLHPPTSQAPFARKINTLAASIVESNPTRYGFFATLPISPSSIPLSVTLSELSHALDSLSAEGVTLFTSYENLYLGNPFFRPLWNELNLRSAVVFIHPASPPSSPSPSSSSVGVPPPIIDFPHETTRAAVSLITSNIIRDFPNVKIILSHGGGTLPFVANRIANLGADAGVLPPGKTAEEFIAEAKTFYFDLALTAFPGAMELVLGFAKPGRVLYGSDYPFCREGTVRRQIDNLREVDEAGEIQAGVVGGLFPRFLAGRGDTEER